MSRHVTVPDVASLPAKAGSPLIAWPCPSQGRARHQRLDAHRRPVEAARETRARQDGRTWIRTRRQGKDHGHDDHGYLHSGVSLDWAGTFQVKTIGRGGPKSEPETIGRSRSTEPTGHRRRNPPRCGRTGGTHDEPTNTPALDWRHGAQLPAHSGRQHSVAKVERYRGPFPGAAREALDPDRRLRNWMSSATISATPRSLPSSRKR